MCVYVSMEIGQLSEKKCTSDEMRKTLTGGRLLGKRMVSKTRLAEDLRVSDREANNLVERTKQGEYSRAVCAWHGIVT